jgi:hypothetical protein
MDVSRIDPEDALVDFQTVEPGDVSADLDEAAIPGPNYGKEDKVLVSIRLFRFSGLFLKHTQTIPSQNPPYHLCTCRMGS